jgi:hypothetical protein
VQLSSKQAMAVSIYPKGDPLGETSVTVAHTLKDYSYIL